MKKNHLKLSIRIALTAVVFVVGMILLLYGIITKDYIRIGYKEDNSINYKVYLKDNPYFEVPYLGENRTYIASLIDYIDIDYKYTIDFTKPVSGKYKYYIRASIYANKPNGETGYYWFKDYSLSDPQEFDIQDTQSFMITKNVKLNYDEYNQILNSFKKEYSMQTNGQLYVSMIVESVTSGEEYTDNIEISSDLKLSIPLLQQTVEASIGKDAVSQSKMLSMADYSNRVFYIVCMIIGMALISLSILLTIDTIIYSIRKSKRNLYKTKLNKILRNHDSIIANVSTLPDMEEMNVIKVTSFEELLDVYNEVRMPINYYQSHKKLESIFMIINDGIIWIYKLNKEDIEG